MKFDFIVSSNGVLDIFKSRVSSSFVAKMVVQAALIPAASHGKNQNHLVEYEQSISSRHEVNG